MLPLCVLVAADCRIQTRIGRSCRINFCCTEQWPKATIYSEGPNAFVDLLLAYLVLKHGQKAEQSLAPDFKVNAVLLTMKFVVLSNFST
jgi:hypothetical protein